jgi:hypothetical protein
MNVVYDILMEGFFDKFKKAKAFSEQDIAEAEKWIKNPETLELRDALYNIKVLLSTGKAEEDIIGSLVSAKSLSKGNLLNAYNDGPNWDDLKVVSEDDLDDREIPQKLYEAYIKIAGKKQIVNVIGYYDGQFFFASPITKKVYNFDQYDGIDEVESIKKYYKL